jgi:rubrerythrin
MMPDNERDQLLLGHIKIESVLNRLYTRFSTQNNLSTPVKKFWEAIALEEKLHADTLNEIRKEVNDGKVAVDIDIKIENLKGFIANLNLLIKKASSDNLSESEAYSLGAEIEANLNESAFTKLIKTSDAKTLALLHRIENDTKKHRVILVNYSRGIK